MHKLIIVCVLMMSTVAFPGDTAKLELSTTEEPFKPVIAEDNKKLYEIVPKPERVKGKVDWIIEHVAVMDGWSFTGYSKYGLTEGFKPYRWHFGIISGELDAQTAMDLQEDRTLSPNEMLERWEGLQTHDVVFGVSFTIRF